MNDACDKCGIGTDDFVMKVPDGPAVLYVNSDRESRWVQTLDKETPFGGFARVDAREKAIMIALLRHSLERWENAETTP